MLFVLDAETIDYSLADYFLLLSTTKKIRCLFIGMLKGPIL